jgi:hypothetical protein
MAMDRREFIFAIGSLPGLAMTACTPSRVCPLCGGKLLSVGNFTDDQSKPSLNIEVWNRAFDEVPQFAPDAPMCSRCLHAYREDERVWKRASELPTSFRRPLSSATLGFPVPGKLAVRSLIVYQQEFAGPLGKDGYSDGLSYWYATTPPGLSNEIRAYAERWHMRLRSYSSSTMPNQEYVEATYSPTGFPQHG